MRNHGITVTNQKTWLAGPYRVRMGDRILHYHCKKDNWWGDADSAIYNQIVLKSI